MILIILLLVCCLQLALVLNTEHSIKHRFGILALFNKLLRNSVDLFDMNCPHESFLQLRNALDLISLTLIGMLIFRIKLHSANEYAPILVKQESSGIAIKIMFLHE